VGVDEGVQRLAAFAIALGLLGLRLIQTQNAMRVASATAERKLRASLS